MEIITAGYVAFNGHVFTETQAEIYMRACETAQRVPSEANLNARHNVFSAIINSGIGQKETAQ